MESLILTFTAEQLEKYYELLSKSDIELDFDTDVHPVGKLKISDTNLIISIIEDECLKLLKFKRYDSLFSVSLSQNEIRDLIPIYFDTVRNIEKCKRRLMDDTLSVSYELIELEKHIAHIYSRYAQFLPYKAALYGREEYCARISETDKRFKVSIETIEDHKSSLVLYFEVSRELENIIDEFFKASAKAVDSPKFKSFDASGFFIVLEGFISQLNAIKKKQKEM